MSLVLRGEKGSVLSHAEMDSNLQFLGDESLLIKNLLTLQHKDDFTSMIALKYWKKQFPVRDNLGSLSFLLSPSSVTINDVEYGLRYELVKLASPAKNISYDCYFLDGENHVTTNILDVGVYKFDKNFTTLDIINVPVTSGSISFDVTIPEGYDEVYFASFFLVDASEISNLKYDYVVSGE